METVLFPPYIDVFLSVVRDNQIAQVALICVFVFIILDWVFGITNAIQHKVGSLLEIFASMNPELQNSPIFAMLDSVNDTEGRHTKDE